MKDVIKFVLFILYCVIIFFVRAPILFGIFVILNLSLAILLNINFGNSLRNLFHFSPFIFIASFINFIFGYTQEGILVAIRLVLVCNITYTFSRDFSAVRIGTTIENILKPLKIFKINSKDIGLVVAIAISFLPILKKELIDIRYSLKSKGIDMKLKNINYILKPFFISVLKKINELELSLNAKAYE